MRNGGQSQGAGEERDAYGVEFETHVEAAVKLLPLWRPGGTLLAGTIADGLCPRDGEMARASGGQ
jgi:hypothetical protein